MGIALFTLLIPGTTVGKLIQSLQLNRPSILDRVGQALAVLIAKREALKQASRLETIDSFAPTVVEGFTQKYQQEVSQAEQSLTNLQTELNLSEAEAQQVVWSEALAIEQQIYRELNDEGFMSQPVLAQLTLMMNLKGDAVQAGNIPPELPKVEPLEVRLGNLLVKLFDGSSWVKKIQAELIATNYEYLTFLAYACEQVPLRLRKLVTDSGIPGTAIEQCTHHYEEIRQEIMGQTQAIVKQSPDLALAFQTKIAARVALVVQNQTIERLTEEGVISEAAAVKTSQLVEVD